MLTEQILRDLLRYYQNSARAEAERLLADYHGRDPDDPHRQGVWDSYNRLIGAERLCGEIPQFIDSEEFRKWRCPDIERIHVDASGTACFRLNDDVFQGIADRIRRDCPDLPEWKLMGITASICSILLDRTDEFLFPGRASSGRAEALASFLSGSEATASRSRPGKRSR